MFKLLSFLPLFFYLCLCPLESKERPTVCLSMIVKNENTVITRCLSSVAPLIDRWVIIDTGSIDGTQDTIKQFFAEKNIPGILYERPWIDFAHNRNEALDFAKNQADYVLFIDADEYFVYESDFQLPFLEKDYYYLTISHANTQYKRIHLIKSSLPWKWVGVLHEVLVPQLNWSYGFLEKIMNIYTSDGCRSRDPEKYQKDAKVLEAALKEDPTNARYTFYLAQSYRDAGDLSSALRYYQQRADMGGWDQEVYYALLQVGIMKEKLQKSFEEVLESYRRAFAYHPSRLEPLYYMTKLLRSKGDYAAAYNVAKIGLAVPPSKDVLFVEKWIEDYGLLFELSISAYWTGHYEECQHLNLELMKKNLPENFRKHVEENLGFANSKLLEKAVSYEPP